MLRAALAQLASGPTGKATGEASAAASKELACQGLRAAARWWAARPASNKRPKGLAWRVLAQVPSVAQAYGPSRSAGPFASASFAQ